MMDTIDIWRELNQMNVIVAEEKNDTEEVNLKY